MPHQTQHDSRPGVAIITNSVPPYREHVHLRIARELPEIKLYTVCTHDSADSRWAHRPSPEINPISFGPYSGESDRQGFGPISFRKGREIIQWIVANDIKAVICLGYNDIGLLRIMLFCRRSGIPCFVWGDSNVRLDRATGIKALLKHLFVGWVMSMITGALACGRYGVGFFEKYGMRTDRIFLFPNEPDYSLIVAADPAEVDAARQKFALATDRRRVVFSGRLVDVKRVDLLIDAFVQIAGDRPQWDLLIIGDGPLRKALEEQIPADLRHRVQWTGFLNDQRTVSALYRLCDVLVLPSDHEPWALVLNEAAAAGLAIIASDIVGAAPELIEEGLNGYTFPPGDVNALRRCLLATTDPDRTDRMKPHSITVLNGWRRRADPVQGLAKALRFAQII